MLLQPYDDVYINFNSVINSGKYFKKIHLGENKKNIEEIILKFANFSN